MKKAARLIGRFFLSDLNFAGFAATANTCFNSWGQISGEKKAGICRLFASVTNYLEAGAAVAEAAGAALDAAAASDAAAGAGAAAGASVADAGAGATTDAAGADAASSFLPQAAKAIAIRDTSKRDFFMFVLSINRSKIRSKFCDE
ncbi:cell wall protein TIR3 [Undibacterium sp. B2R-29]|nr:cell wall protein TIR3 [Undibacterium crateris]NDI84434.1 cell wall protein TIR3 [Undibacterium crateris]